MTAFLITPLDRKSNVVRSSVPFLYKGGRLYNAHRELGELGKEKSGAGSEPGATGLLNGCAPIRPPAKPLKVTFPTKPAGNVLEALPACPAAQLDLTPGSRLPGLARLVTEEIRRRLRLSGEARWMARRWSKQPE